MKKMPHPERWMWGISLNNKNRKHNLDERVDQNSANPEPKHVRYSTVIREDRLNEAKQQVEDHANDRPKNKDEPLDRSVDARLCCSGGIVNLVQMRVIGGVVDVASHDELLI